MNLESDSFIPKYIHKTFPQVFVFSLQFRYSCSIPNLVSSCESRNSEATLQRRTNSSVTPQLVIPPLPRWGVKVNPLLLIYNPARKHFVTSISVSLASQHPNFATYFPRLPFTWHTFFPPLPTPPPSSLWSTCVTRGGRGTLTDVLPSWNIPA